MKRLSTIFLAVLLLAGLFPAAAVGEDAGLSLSCPSAILMEKETGTILYEQDAHQKLEPASVTKIMTLLLVMEAVDSGRIALADVVGRDDQMCHRCVRQRLCCGSGRASGRQ